jgi:2-dehydro-3-deoxyglucarate aldolase
MRPYLTSGAPGGQRDGMSTFKDRVGKNVPTFGSWITLGHPAIPEVLATAGFEWLVIDLEHSVIPIDQAGELIRVIDLLGLAPLVRLTANVAGQIKRVLDAGAHGVIVPMVNSADDARAAVSSVRYPPAGARGVGLSRAQGYGTRFLEYISSWNDRAVVIVQIEHIDAIDAIEEILAVPGLDATLIGPYDLSASMGKPGAFDDPEFVSALERYEAASRRAGIPMGYHVVEPDRDAVRRRIERGYTVIALGVDFLFLGNACRGAMAGLKTEGIR